MNKGQQICLDILTNYYGEKEVNGEDVSNPIILKIINWAMPSVTDDGDVAWCAISASYFINQCDGEFPPILVARDFLNVGIEVEVPQFGDMVIFWRYSPESWQGHVGWVIRAKGDYVWVLGGNQENQFNIRKYSLKKKLGYRRII